jgi:menaquinol-cytochrome c reductase iron-sulfur subunit
MNENTNSPPAGCPPAEPQKTVPRRRFIEWLSISLGALCAAIVALPIVGFILAPLFSRKPEQWISLGKIDDFKIGETVSVAFNDPSPLPWAGITARTAAWLRREDEKTFIAFSVNCTHLGCPVRWLADAELFMCPCHGGVYYKDGSVAAGPPPHPLFRYEMLVENGEVKLKSAPIPITTTV